MSKHNRLYTFFTEESVDKLGKKLLHTKEQERRLNTELDKYNKYFIIIHIILFTQMSILLFGVSSAYSYIHLIFILIGFTTLGFLTKNKKFLSTIGEKYGLNVNKKQNRLYRISVIFIVLTVILNSVRFIL